LPPPVEAQTLTRVIGVPVTTTDLATPVFVTSWPGNTKLLVVVERGKRAVTLWDTADPAAAPQTIVEIPEAYLPVSTTSDFIGITGVAFHPKFLDAPGGGQRFLYVRYNRAATIEPGVGTTFRTFVKRYQIKPGKVSVAQGSETTVYTWPTMLTGHGSGTLAFDRRPNLPSARLYVPMPDHAPGSLIGSSGMTHACCLAAGAQGSPSASDVGRLLAIEVDVTGFPLTVEAQGLRNPWGTSVDRGDALNSAGRGDVWMGDTRHMFTGSVIRLIPGSGPIANYGWPWREVNGDEFWTMQPIIRDAHCHSSPMLYTTPPENHPCPESVPQPPYSLPYLGFSDRDEFGLGSHDAMIGGHVYRGTSISALTNRYIFATYGVFTRPRIYHASISSPGTPVRMMAAGQDLPQQAGWNTNQLIMSIGEDFDGDWTYVVVVDTTFPGVVVGNGSIWRLNQ